MIEESINFQVDGLALEGRLSYADWVAAPDAAVLICPPHPFLGGDMCNNVVLALAATLAEAGLPVLRFNYRGIGASESQRDLIADQREFWLNSTCPKYESEILVDCEHAFTELRRILPEALSLYLVGYSFGCLPALAIAAAGNVGKLCLISPPLAKWPIPATLTDASIPRALCFAPGDFACPTDMIAAFYERLDEPKQIHAFPNADHFFIGQERELATVVCRFLQNP